MVNNDRDEKIFYEKKVRECKKIIYFMKAIGSHNVPITPIIGTKLYNQVYKPKLCYGIEVVNINNDTMTQLETFYFQAAKLCQGLPHCAPNYGALAVIGWNKFKVIVILRDCCFYGGYYYCR